MKVRSMAIVASLLLLAAPGAAAHAGNPFKLSAHIKPSKLHYNEVATLEVSTKAGAECLADVEYNDGRAPTSWRKYHNVWFKVPKSGALALSWHEMTKSDGGFALIDCYLGKMHASATLDFAVSRQ